MPNWLKWVISGVVAIVAIAAVVAITLATAGIGTAIGSALGGGIAATIFGSAIGGAVTGALTGIVMGASINIISQGFNKGYENINWEKVGVEALIGAGTGALSGAILGAGGKALGLLGKTKFAQRVIPNLKNSKSAFMFGSKSGSFTFARFGSGNGFFRLEASLVHGFHFHIGLTNAVLRTPRIGLIQTIWNAITVFGSYLGRNK